MFQKGRHLEFYIVIDPKNNSHLYLDMTYPPAKFDVNWSKETQVIVEKTIKFDTPAQPPTSPI